MEIAGSDSDETAWKRLLMLANKYNRSMLEPRLLFPHAYDKLYLVSQELTTRTDTVWKEDRWLLSQLLDEMKLPGGAKAIDEGRARLADVLTPPLGKLHLVSILLTGDYSMRIAEAPRRPREGGALDGGELHSEAFHRGRRGRGLDALVSGAHCVLLDCFHDEESYVEEMSSPRRAQPVQRAREAAALRWVRARQGRRV